MENIAITSFNDILNQLTGEIIILRKREDDYQNRIADLEHYVAKLEKKNKKLKPKRKDVYIEELEKDTLKLSFRNVQLADGIKQIEKLLLKMRNSNIKENLGEIINSIKHPLKDRIISIEENLTSKNHNKVGIDDISKG